MNYLRPILKALLYAAVAVVLVAVFALYFDNLLFAVIVVALLGGLWWTSRHRFAAAVRAFLNPDEE